MSLIQFVTISINRCSMPEGHLCRIDYSYSINPDNAAYATTEHFRVACELRGETRLGDKQIGADYFDVHEIAATDAMPVHRSFMVECETLDDRVGEDAVYVRLHFEGERGETFAADSGVVHDYF